MIEWADIDWGNAPAWGALTAAVVAACLAGRNVLVDRRDRQREQAGRVAAWWGSSVGEYRGHLMGPVLVHGAWVRNASDVPVYDVYLVYVYDGAEKARDRISVLPPGDEAQFRPYPVPDAPGSADARSTDKALAAMDIAEPGGMGVRISFRDSRGRTWSRTEHGVLDRT